MKRNRIILCLLLIFLMLTGCGEKASTVYTTTENGHTLTVDASAGTITDEDGQVYTFTISATGSKLTITYPNGATYFWNQSGNMAHGGWSDDYDPDHYLPGDVLLDAMNGSSPKANNSGNRFLGILFIALGAFNTFWPQASWYLSHGWRYKDAEPSDAALILTRFGGIAVILFGAIALLA